MPKMSASFTVGKASAPHGANVEHNNREFVADNVDVNRIADNITYVKQDVREAYNELFGEALREYNAKQKQPCRKINDYYEHISNSKREEAFYELVVQFGDSIIAPVGSDSGELAKKMLDEYMKGFQERNPNLKVFNAVLHMDEASPHLHINIIPYYKEPRKNGLSTGVSMKAALDEQGFTAKNFKENRLVAWEDSELKAMEQILNRHGLERDKKGATYSHMTVEEFKISKAEEKLTATLESAQKWKQDSENDVERIRQENNLLKYEKEKLEKQKRSPWKAFYYSDSEKQSFVQTQLDELGIPYRETENGFEAQDCYVDEIRRLEKSYKPKENPHRETLRENLDKFVMQSKSFDEVLEKLKAEGYKIRLGKYISVTPRSGSQSIRLKSLGEEYSEQALRNRIVFKQRYEKNVDDKIAATRNPVEVAVYKTVKHYTIVFAQAVLPVRKKNQKKPLTWENDSEIDKLVELRKKIQGGVTVDSLRNEFAWLESRVAEKENQLAAVKKEQRFFERLHNAAERVYQNGAANKDDVDFLTEHKITAENYSRLRPLIEDNARSITQLEQELSGEREKLRDVSETLAALEKVVSGTYVQSLIDDEKLRRSGELVNGVLPGDSTKL